MQKNKKHYINNENNKLKIKIFYIDDSITTEKQMNSFFNNTKCKIIKTNELTNRVFVYYEDV